ncbi:MAG: ankyrin repeat domain-containing protein, partial [Actinobacteria bacterium]|nr:ankyrin repeat domain-containing protein [Actinomycetota bacterium]
MAIRLGVANAVQLHIAKGVDVNSTDDGGMSPLMYAADAGQAEICRVLLEAGADPLQCNDEGRDAHFFALKNGSSAVGDVLRRFLGNRSDELQRQDDSQSVQGRISLHIALDNDEDWSDVEIDLPDVDDRLRQVRFLEFWEIASAERLIAAAIHTGRISLQQLDAELGSGDEPDREFRERLVLVLGELGAHLSDLDFEPEQLKELESSGIESDGSDGQLFSDAISFLVELTAQEDDPEAIYYKEVRSYNLLSRDEEAILGRRIEEATASTMGAIANCPPAISRLLEFAQRVAAGEMRIETFVQSIPDSEDDVERGGLNEDDETIDEPEVLNAEVLSRFDAIRR